jgi:hypothetical protein
VSVPTFSAAMASEVTSAYWPDTDVGQYHALPLRLHLALSVLLI